VWLVVAAVARGDEAGDESLVELIPLVRRVVAARVRDHQLVDDLVQETLLRVMAARHRIEQDTVVPYAVTIARNLVTATGRGADRDRRHAHLFAEETPQSAADDELLLSVEVGLVDDAMGRLPVSDREVLLAHEVHGAGTAELADDRGSTPGAVAAQLNRARARLRMEYLIADHGTDPPTDRCRPVLYALSIADRRRQRELDASGHLLTCDYCLTVSGALFERRPPAGDDDQARVLVTVDADVVIARQRGREVAARAGFTGTDLTVIATAISELARNVVKFAPRGEIVVRVVQDGARRGVEVLARDAGPGIIDVAEAMRDGFSTGRGLGMGLGGVRRLMDEFDIVSEVGRGTTVTAAKWSRHPNGEPGRPPGTTTSPPQ
jgi:serine/threonine-protein kinase RsbT